jgi:hypothetical protein
VPDWELVRDRSTTQRVRKLRDNNGKLVIVIPGLPTWLFRYWPGYIGLARVGKLGYSDINLGFVRLFIDEMEL